MLKNLFDKCVKLASSKVANYALGLISFIESFFFPVPPDLMIVPMVVAKRENYIKIFLIATIFSVLGGLVGYTLGIFFLDISMVIIEFYGYEEKVYEIQNKISSKGGFIFWIGVMFLAGFTPLPFKLFTIASGIVNFNIIVFFFICLFTRGLRFFLVSYFTYLFGSKFSSFIEIVLKHTPCNLCLAERIPYIVSIILALTVLISNKYEKFILIVIGLLFSFGAIVSFYHFGIEQGFFNESLVCDLGLNSQATTTQDLLKELDTKTISCKDVTFRIFGFSLATFNTIISFLISAIMLNRGLKYDKN